MGVPDWKRQTLVWRKATNVKQLNAQVCVLGGGPAGATTALRLMMLGHSVVLVEKSSFPRPHIGESLIGGVLPLLDVLGLRQEIEQESFLRTRAAFVRWAGTTEYRKLDGANGFQVDRARFDHLILRTACKAGAHILQPASAIEITKTGEQGWTLAVQTSNGDRANVNCSFLVDATGRTSILGGARTRTGAPTLALYAYWKDTAIYGTETRVEAGQSEWFWGAPLPQGQFNATVFIDTPRFAQGVAAAGSLENFYCELIGSSGLLAGCLKGARITPVRVCDATCTCDETPLLGNSIKAGEAAFSIDPLSSQGVQTAIGSALHAAAVIHTIMERPDSGGLARQFYVERQQQSVALHGSATRQFYAEAAKAHPTEFWQRRSIPSSPSDVPAPSQPSPMPAPESLVRIAPGVCLRTVPIIENAFVVSATAVVVPSLKGPVVFLEGTKAAPLIEMIDVPMACQEVLRRWTTAIPSSLALTILRRALDLGILCFDNQAS